MNDKTDIGFGTVKGVFIPSILTILGVILFLRLGWVVGQAGLASTIVIILLSSLITFITSLSISSRATNSDIGAGGTYYLISRCFGVEPGAAVGIPLYLAQALGVSFYSVGFAESIQLFYPDVSILLVAFVTLIILTIITFYSANLALRMQTIIFIAIILALVSFFFGSPVESVSVADNTPSQRFGFWHIFAVFFPAVTGIEAGISMSGDLKNPSKSLPIGTLAAVIIGGFVYIVCAFVYDYFADPESLISGSLIMSEIALFPILIFIGLWGATLSSAVGALLGAPRTLQALAVDRIVPSFLAKGSKLKNEPQRATVFSFVVAAFGILLGDLNTIAAILSMFFLTSYGALNLVSGLEGLLDNPSWRPSFKISWLVSLIGAVLCFGVMFMINSGYSFIALASIILIYFYMKKRKITSNYSDIRTSLTLHLMRACVYKLNQLKFDARNWRPNFLILSGSPKSRMHLIELSNDINHRRGFMTVATVLLKDKTVKHNITNFEKSIQHFLEKLKINSLTKVIEADSFSGGAMALINNYGIGVVNPNTVVLGDTSDSGKIPAHVEIIKEAHHRSKNVLIVKDTSQTYSLTHDGGRSIDVWWRGHEGNADLMLTLAFMLKTSDKWKDAELKLKSIAKNEEEKKGMSENIRSFLKHSRLPASFEIYLDDKTNVFKTIVNKSKDTDIVFLGLNKPDNEPDYEKYYDRFINQPPRLKTTVFVLAGEDTSYVDIFK